jgi:hypothetical protein
MDLAFWNFVADSDGQLKLLPFARMMRLWRGSEQLSERAGQEVKLVQIALEVDRCSVRRVLSVLPRRMGVRPDGTLDTAAARRQVLEELAERLDPLRPDTPERAIRRLERDANRFWELDREHTEALAGAIGCDPEDIVRATWRPEGPAGRVEAL